MWLCYLSNEVTRDIFVLGRLSEDFITLSSPMTSMVFISKWSTIRVRKAPCPYSEKVPLGFRFRTPFLLRLCLCRWTETQQFSRIHATKGTLMESAWMWTNTWRLLPEMQLILPSNKIQTLSVRVTKLVQTSPLTVTLVTVTVLTVPNCPFIH